jgi:hypothetical protein
VDSMLVETAHVWNTPGKGFILRGMCAHYILGISTLEFQRLRSILSWKTSRVGDKTVLMIQWLVLRQSFALVDEIFRVILRLIDLKGLGNRV